jgi:hypothetical protein
MHADPITAAEVTATTHTLPTGRITRYDNAAHVFLDNLTGLAQWLEATGGYTTCRPAGPGLVAWTLITHTEPRGDGTATPVLVHAMALASESVPDALATAAA